MVLSVVQRICHAHNKTSFVLGSGRDLMRTIWSIYEVRYTYSIGTVHYLTVSGEVKRVCAVQYPDSTT